MVGQLNTSRNILVVILSFITIFERLFNQYSVKYLGISGIHPIYQRIIISITSISIGPFLYITSPSKEFFWSSFKTYSKPKVAWCFLCGFSSLILLSFAIVYTTPGIMLATFSLQSLFVVMLQKLILKNSIPRRTIISSKIFVCCLMLFIIFTPKRLDSNKNIYLGVILSLVAGFLGAIFLTISDMILKREKKKTLKRILWNNFFFQFLWGIYFILFSPILFLLHFIKVVPFGTMKAKDIYTLLLLFILVRIYWIAFIGGIIISSSAIMAFFSTLIIPFSYFMDVFRGYLSFSLVSFIISIALFVLLVIVLWDQMNVINEEKENFPKKTISNKI